MAEVTLTDNNFNDEVIKSTIPVLVDFWGSSCGPCKALAPIIEELAQEIEGKLKIGKLNIEENTETPGQFGVMSVPTLAFFKEGKVVKTLVGVKGRDEIKKVIEEILT